MRFLLLNRPVIGSNMEPFCSGYCGEDVFAVSVKDDIITVN